MANTKWTYESIEKEAKKYKTKQDFRTKSSLAYAAAKSRKIIDKVCSHMLPAYTSWTYGTIVSESKNIKPRKGSVKKATQPITLLDIEK